MSITPIIDVDNENNQYIYLIYVYKQGSRPKEIILSQYLVIKCYNNYISVCKSNNGSIFSICTVDSEVSTIIICYDHNKVMIYVNNNLIFEHKLLIHIFDDLKLRDLYLLKTDQKLNDLDMHYISNIARKLNPGNSYYFIGIEDIAARIKSNKNTGFYISNLDNDIFSIRFDKYIYYSNEAINKKRYKINIDKLLIKDGQLYINSNPNPIDIDVSKVEIQTTLSKLVCITKK